MNMNDSIKDSKYLIDLYQASQIWTYTPVRATYDELFSGNISTSIPNDNLRKKLANYYVAQENSQQILREPTPYRDNIRMYLPHNIQTQIRQKCGDLFTFDNSENTYLSLPDRCDIVFSDASISNAAYSLEQYKSLKVDLTRQLSGIETKITQLEAYVSSNRNLLKYIEKLIDKHSKNSIG